MSQHYASRVEAAHAFRNRGWRVLPLHRVGPDGQTCSCSRGANCPSKGKHPIHSDWQNTPALSAADIEALWEERDHNVGVVTGTPSGLFVVDIDPDHGGLESWRRIKGDKEMPRTQAVRTGSGGWHFYLSLPSDFEITNSPAAFKGTGIDIRGTGGQVVAPPSVTDKGEYHEYIADVAPAPEWLLELVRPQIPDGPVVLSSDVPDRSDLPAEEQKRLDQYAKKVVDSELERLDRLAVTGWDGEPWNQTTYNASCSLLEIANSRWNSFTPKMAYDAVFRHAPRDPGFGDEEVNKCFESAVSKIGDQARAMPEGKPRDEGIPDFIGAVAREQGTSAPAPATGGGVAVATDEAAPELTTKAIVANSQIHYAYRLAESYADRLMYVGTSDKRGTWYRWDGRRWATSIGDAKQCLLEILDEDGRQAARLGDAGKNLLLQVKSMSKNNALEGSLSIASTLPELSTTTANLDGDPYLLNTPSGTLDLRTMELRDHDPADRLTKMTRGAYRPGERHARWESFLEQVLPDTEVRGFLQRLLGYSLLGVVREHVLPILTGEGGNGKGTFDRAVANALGQYASVGEPDLLMTVNGDRNTAGQMNLRGTRWCVVSESDSGRQFAEATMKRLTGGDSITARALYQDFVTFDPSHTLCLITNHLPKVSSDDPAVWRRLRVIPFDVKITADEVDNQLDETLQLAADAIITWAVEGYQEYERVGLAEPPHVLAATDQYRVDNDEVAQFLADEEAVVVDPEARVKQAALYDAYTKWRFDLRRRGAAQSRRAFLQAVERLGYAKEHTRQGDFRVGIGLTARFIPGSLEVPTRQEG